VDYAQNPYTEEQPTFTIFTERLVREPSGSVLFDRSDPARYPTFSSLELEPDRGVFSALRQSQVVPGSSATIDPLVISCAQQISRFNKFRLDPSVLCAPSRMPDLPVVEAAGAAPAITAPRLGHHGEDLAATLYYLSETKSPELERIKDRLKEIDSQFSGFEFNNLGTDRVAFSAVYSDPRQIVPAVRLSAGMLTYLGLIVLVSTPNRPPVLMIEEPENGLTPQAIRAFYRAVKELAYAEEPERRSQVLLSSHSPFVICEAWNGEDRDFIHQVKVVDGKAVVRRFSEVTAEHHIQLAPDAEGPRAHLSLGNAEEIMSGYLS
jgi:hypothetical protein